MLFRTVPSPTTYITPFHRLEVRKPHPKFLIGIISGTGKDRDFKFGRYIHRVHPNKSPLKVLEKRERGRIHGLLNFGVYPLLSQEQNFKFCTHIHSIDQNKSPFKILGKVTVGVVRDSQ